MNFLKKLFGQVEKKRTGAAADAEMIASYRKRFSNSLAGKWISAEGTFLMQEDVFEFFETGKGYWLSSGSSYAWRTDFDWRQKGPLTIEMQTEEDTEDEWLELEYDFKLIENDVAKQVILHQKGFDTFYMAVTRVAYCGELNEKGSSS